MTALGPRATGRPKRCGAPGRRHRAHARQFDERAPVVSATDIELRIPDLVKRCGCSVGNFYLRFPNKETYFKALQAEVMTQADALVVERLQPKQLAAMSAAEVVGSMVDLMADIFTSQGRGVYRESFLRIQEADDPWAPMRLAGRDIMRRYVGGTADKFVGLSEQEAGERLRFCFQTVVGVLQNELVNDYHVHSTRDGSVREALKLMLGAYMAVPTPQPSARR